MASGFKFEWADEPAAPDNNSNLNNLPSVEEGAIFLADAHENANKKAFLSFLHALENGAIAMPPQLFLMGDMFDFLSFTTYAREFYAKYVSLINALANKTEIWYFEGNHDFALGSLFPRVRVLRIENQPFKFEMNGRALALAHGDVFLPPLDAFALRFLRNSVFLKIADALDKLFKFEISKRILRFEEGKRLDYKIPNFKGIIAAKLAKYDAEAVIEGHYHQGELFKFESKFYLNLNCFASERSYFVVKYPSKKEIEFQIVRSPNV